MRQARGILIGIAVVTLVATVFAIIFATPNLCFAKVKQYNELFSRVAQAYGLDKCLLLAIANVESGFDPAAISDAGAVGLMQLMPDTARWVAMLEGVAYTYDDLFDPEYNVDLACRYLVYLSARFEGEWILAAYNAGEGVVRRWQSEGIEVEDVPYDETRRYVAKVRKIAKRYRRRGYSG